MTTPETNDGRVVEVIEPEDEATWPVERTDVCVSRTRTETWDPHRKSVRKHTLPS